MKGKTTVESAIDILGEKKVLTCNQASKMWEISVPPDLQSIPYDSHVLNELAMSNSQSLSDWRLVFLMSLSLRQQYAVLPDQFDPNAWWIDCASDGDCPWVQQKTYLGYVLFDFQPRFDRMTYDQQVRSISQLGPTYEHAHGAAVVEAVLSIDYIHKEQLLQNHYHRCNFGVAGSCIPPDFHPVGVGPFSEGIAITILPKGLLENYIGVVVQLKPSVEPQGE